MYAVDEVFCLAGSLGPRLAAEKASAAKQLAEEVLGAVWCDLVRNSGGGKGCGVLVGPCPPFLRIR